MTKNNNGPSSSDGQAKNGDEELLEKIRNWKSPNDLPENLQEKLDQLSSQIWDSRGLPIPIAEFFENLQLTFKNLQLVYEESIERISIAEWFYQHGIPWPLYAELRGSILAKYDPKRKGEE